MGIFPQRCEGADKMKSGFLTSADLRQAIQPFGIKRFAVRLTGQWIIFGRCCKHQVIQTLWKSGTYRFDESDASVAYGQASFFMLRLNLGTI